MGPGGGPTKMHENPRVSRPLPPHLGVVFDAAASTLVSTLCAFSSSVSRRGACPLVSTRFDPVRNTTKSRGILLHSITAGGVGDAAGKSVETNLDAADTSVRATSEHHPSIRAFVQVIFARCLMSPGSDCGVAFPTCGRTASACWSRGISTAACHTRSTRRQSNRMRDEPLSGWTDISNHVHLLELAS
jgi:hypothetical protein